MAQLLHFLGEQGVHLALQGARRPLAAVQDGAGGQHGRRLQAAQAAEAVAAAAVAEQQRLGAAAVSQQGAHGAVVGGRGLLPAEAGLTAGREVGRRGHGVGRASPRDAAGAGGSLRRLGLRPDVLGPERLPGFGPGEGDGSEHGLGTELKLRLHAGLGRGSGLLGLGLDGGGLGPGYSLGLGLFLGGVASLLYLPFSLPLVALPLSLRTLLGAHHTGDAVGRHPHLARAVERDPGEDPRLGLHRVVKAEPTGPFQRLAHGPAAGEERALTFALLGVESPVGVPGALGLVRVPVAVQWCGGRVRGGSRGLVLRLLLLAGALRAVVFGVDGDLREALLDLGLTFGGCTGSAAQEVGTERVLTTVLCNSMAVQGSLLWVSVKQPFYAAGCSGLTKAKERRRESLSNTESTKSHSHGEDTQEQCSP